MIYCPNIIQHYLYCTKPPNIHQPMHAISSNNVYLCNGMLFRNQDWSPISCITLKIEHKFTNYIFKA